MDELEGIKKYALMRDELFKINIPPPLPTPKLITPEIYGIDIHQFDTKYVETIFMQIKTGIKCVVYFPCFVPNYRSKEFHLLEPLHHEERMKWTHEWLTKIGTPKYLEQIEEVAIAAKRLAQFSEGFYPHTLSFEDKPNLLKTFVQERVEKLCPLLHFRNLGNGFYVLVNINDMVPYSLDMNPLFLR